MLPRTKMFLMIAFVCFGVAVMFYMSYKNEVLGKNYLDPAEVRSASLLVDTTSYVLSYEQQEKLVHLLNTSKLLDPQEDVSKGTKPLFTKIILYRFKDTVIEVIPILYLGDDLLFNCLDWQGGALLKDNSHGELKKLLGEAFEKMQEKERPKVIEKIKI